MDLKDNFDYRLDALHSGKTPESEITAAINIYERLKTAQSIVESLHPTGGSPSGLLTSVFEALCVEAKEQRDNIAF